MKTYPSFPISPRYTFPFVSADTSLVNAQMHAAEATEHERLDWTPDRLETNICGRQEFIEEHGREAWDAEMESLLLEALTRRIAGAR